MLVTIVQLLFLLFVYYTCVILFIIVLFSFKSEKLYFQYCISNSSCKSIFILFLIKYFVLCFIVSHTDSFLYVTIKTLYCKYDILYFTKYTKVVVHIILHLDKYNVIELPMLNVLFFDSYINLIHK